MGVQIMGGIKKVSLSTLRRIVGVSGKQYKKVQWHTTTVIVKQLLGINDYINLIRKILDDCVSSEGEIAVDLLDFSIRSNVIAAYSFVDLPTDAEELYYLIYCSDLYDTVCSAINKAQLDSIKESVKLHVV